MHKTLPRLGDIIRLIREPEAFLTRRLEPNAEPLLQQALHWLAPALLVRPAAVLVRSLIAEAPLSALVLAIGSLALEIGVWLAVGTVLPALASQFQTRLHERESLLVVGFASVPLWLAGAFFVVPDTVPVGFVWSRALVLVVSLYGLFLAFRAFAVLGIRPEARWPLVAALGVTYAAVYFVLFVLLGISSYAALFLLGASR